MCHKPVKVSLQIIVRKSKVLCKPGGELRMFDGRKNMSDSQIECLPHHQFDAVCTGERALLH